MKSLYGNHYNNVQGRVVPADYKRILKDWLEPKKSDNILELGSQIGDMLKFVRDFSPKTTGSDLNPAAAKMTKNVIICDATSLPVKDKSFDKSFSIHTIEHIHELEKVFLELDRITKKTGLSLHAFPSSLIRGIDGAYIDAWKLTHNPFHAFKLARELHVHKLNPKKIMGFLNNSNWHIKKAKRIYVPKERGFSWVVLLKKE